MMMSINTKIIGTGKGKDLSLPLPLPLPELLFGGFIDA